MDAKELKTEYWKAAQEDNDLIIQYDDVIDTLFIYYTPEEDDRIITYFVDEYVAFLYRRSDKEIIGMRIEYFEKLFLPKDAYIKEWNLRDTGVEICGVTDIRFVVNIIREEKASRRVPSMVHMPIEQGIQLSPEFAPCPA